MTAATESSDRSGFVRGQAEAMTDLQKNFLFTLEEIGGEWVSRLGYEAALWSQLMSRLAAARSAPDVFGAYSDCVSRRLQMAGDDSERLVDHYHRMAQQFADALDDGLRPLHSSLPASSKAPTIPGKAREVSATRTRRRRAG